jgi:hypothetical protein
MQADPQATAAAGQHNGTASQREALHGAMNKLSDLIDLLLETECAGTTCFCACEVRKLTGNLQSACEPIECFSCTYDLWEDTQLVLANLFTALFRTMHEAKALRAAAEVYSV